MTAALRVLMVGRDDIERSLRRDESLEVLRARTATDAIGELGLAATDGETAPICVLLAPGAVDGSDEAGWLEAMRCVRPQARFASIGGPTRPGFDGSIDRNAGAEELRRIAAGEATPESPARPAVAIAQLPTPLDELPDRALVEASLRGESLLPQAMSLIRRRAGLSKAAFLRDEVAAPDDDRHAVAVMRGGVQFGWMVGPSEQSDALDGAAAWLASWLALEEQRRQLQDAAFTDELTGTWNRRYFMRFLDRSIEQARKQRRDVTLMVYDIDDFKRYNDAFGHAAGDEILRETVRLLRSVIRPTDRVCRIGGDEFAVIFDDPSGPRSGEGRHPTSIADIATRFQRQVCSHQFPKLGPDAQGTLTVSGGLATFPWDGHDAASLLERADQLSLTSKRQGKNVITLGQGAERVCRMEFGPRSADRP